MKYLKKKLEIVDGIRSSKIEDRIAKKVTSFYTSKPFPNYKVDDDKITISEKGNKNYLASKFKKFVGYNKNVLEVGCGTGQLSIYFSTGNNNLIVALDATLESLKIAKDFANKNNINNIEFVNTDIFDDVLAENYFDFVWCNGVLHHTKDPYKAFCVISKSLKKEGYILVGLYNKFGRIRTIIRKYLYKFFGKNFLKIFDPTLKKLKVSDGEQDAWIQDQYSHPQESMHTINEVLEWFDKNNIEFISSIPSCDFEISDNSDLFVKQSKGNFLTRFLKQITMIFNALGSDGGLFVLIGKKR
jgi:2-polyprenyl-3-methyl-5-hydroxy-6-metoxy-1,4-benzoquinol methylase|tara:strand:+ start:740 stop:1639 length:900 start_codon:yes stop_codon:yes gene_type:complete